MKEMASVCKMAANLPTDVFYPNIELFAMCYTFLEFALIAKNEYASYADLYIT